MIIVYIRSEKAHSSLQAKYWVFSRINVRLIKLISLSFIRWWGNVVYSVEKSYVDNLEKKGKRKVQGVPQSQTAALPRPQEEEETDKSKQAQTEQTYEKL